MRKALTVAFLLPIVACSGMPMPTSNPDDTGRGSIAPVVTQEDAAETPTPAPSLEQEKTDSTWADAPTDGTWDDPLDAVPYGEMSKSALGFRFGINSPPNFTIDKMGRVTVTSEITFAYEDARDGWDAGKPSGLFTSIVGANVPWDRYQEAKVGKIRCGKEPMEVGQTQVCTIEHTTRYPDELLDAYWWVVRSPVAMWPSQN